MVKASQVINDVSGSIILFFGLIMGLVLINKKEQTKQDVKD